MDIASEVVLVIRNIVHEYHGSARRRLRRRRGAVVAVTALNICSLYYLQHRVSVMNEKGAAGDVLCSLS
jgi:hypothetical protein